MFGTNAGVIQPGADGVGFDNLAIGRLHHKALGAVQHADAGQVQVGKTGRVFAALNAFTARLNPNQINCFIVTEGVEDAHGVAAPTDAGHNDIG